MAPKGRVSTRFILRLRLSTEHHYAFKPSPCLKRVEFPLNEQIFNTIGINVYLIISSAEFRRQFAFFVQIIVA
ncbi:MAG: hypothetical protein ACRDC6_08420 [Shewanella sp.]